MSRGAEAPVFAVIGNPVAHSLSPAIHNAALAALGLDGTYVAFRATDAGAAVAAMRAFENLHGLSVTIPHKVAIVEHLDQIEPLARRAGAVNTVSRDRDRGLVGSNSDGPGAISALRGAGIEPAGRRVLILGSGGTAVAVAAALSALDPPPAAVQVGARNAARRREIVARLSDLAPIDDDAPTELRAAVERAEIVVNCTPVGMAPHADQTPVDARWLTADKAVLDAVYSPVETRLLLEAAAAGCTVVPGTELLLAQAAVQLEGWTGRRAPLEAMRAALQACLRPSMAV